MTHLPTTSGQYMSEMDVTCLDPNENYLIYYSSMDDANKLWLGTLHDTWELWKNSIRVTQMLTDYYDSAPNPYLSTLRLLVNVSDFKKYKTKTSLSFTVVKEFSTWISTRRDLYRSYLDVPLKRSAFVLLAKQKNLQLTKLVSDAYEFVEDNVILLPLIRQMILEKKYKDAAQYATMLRLQLHFTNPEQLSLPLILQSKLITVTDLVADCEKAQIALVQYLDRLLSPEADIKTLLTSFVDAHDIPEVKRSAMELRAMHKLVGRLAKSYNLSPEMCPNLNLRRGEGALKFLIYKRYVEGSLGGESWNEMTRETVGTDPRLQLELVRCLAHANDPKEAVSWAKEYEVPQNQWPWSIVGYEDVSSEVRSDSRDVSTNNDYQEENWDDDTDKIKYHCFRLPKDSIKIVDNIALFDEFLTNGLKDVDLVGLDSEWKPSFGTKQNDLALIQIATKTNVYILDVISIGKGAEESWARLGTELFDNKNILKLGFGLAYDISTIKESLPTLSNIRVTGQGYMDVLHLWRQLVKEHRIQFPHKGDASFTKESLSKLVELCMGCRLDKADQFSNWERRPLRDSQLTYAALDAFCLIEIFETLRVQSEHLRIPFHEICAEIQHMPSAQKVAKKSSKKIASKARKYNNPNDHSKRDVEKVVVSEPSSVQQLAHSWRVVCDSMLGGLARQLRMCGCDCVYVEYDRRGDRSTKIAMRQKRVLLTRGGAYSRLAQYVPRGNCYRVLSDKPEDQLKEVLGNFKVVVTQKDIFSRCQICNYDEFVQVSRGIVAELKKNFPGLARRNGGYQGLSNESSDAVGQGTVVTAAASNDNCNATDDADPSVSRKADRTWQLRKEETIDVANCTTRYGVTIQIDKVPTNVLKNVETFYICECCGKVYWDGSHMDKALNGVLRDIISPGRDHVAE